jgi:hypothetical protein
MADLRWPRLGAVCAPLRRVRKAVSAGRGDGSWTTMGHGLGDMANATPMAAKRGIPGSFETFRKVGDHDGRINQERVTFVRVYAF